MMHFAKLNPGSLMQKESRKVREFRRREQEILDSALRLFLEQGEDSVTVEMIADEVGIGKGTIYKHFKSKDELVEKALRHAVDGLKASLAMHTGPDVPLSALFDTYLSAGHRANPEQGCPLPTISAELGQRGQQSEITDEVVQDRLDNIASKLEGDDSRAQAVLVLSAMVGALLLSRSVKDEALSAELLSSTREQRKALTESA